MKFTKLVKAEKTIDLIYAEQILKGDMEHLIHYAQNLLKTLETESVEPQICLKLHKFVENFLNSIKTLQ